ncbi:MAG: SoxR reducing system RseC family protein [Wenzhouxiangella sp.]
MLAVDAGQVQVRLQALQHCQRCLRGEGCGAGVFSRLFAPRSSELWLCSTGVWQPGQRLRIGLAEPELMRLAALLYGVPLLAFILAAALAATFFDEPGFSDLAALSGGLLAGGLAFLLVGKRGGRNLNPSIESLSGSPAEQE